MQPKSGDTGRMTWPFDPWSLMGNSPTINFHNLSNGIPSDQARRPGYRKCPISMKEVYNEGGKFARFVMVEWATRVFPRPLVSSLPVSRLPGGPKFFVCTGPPVCSAVPARAAGATSRRVRVVRRKSTCP